MSEANLPVVLVSGASGHVGRAVVLELQRRARLALFGRRSGSVPGLEDASGHREFAVDLADAQRVRSAVAEVQQTLGPISAVVHTVGGYLGGSALSESSADEARRMMDLNYFSALTLIQAAVPAMLAAKQPGTLVLFGSAAALKASQGVAAYAASKAALLRYAEALADEVQPHVRVRVILPTTIDTPVNRKAMPEGRFADWVTPEQIASTVGFLIDEASSGIRFATIPMGR